MVFVSPSTTKFLYTVKYWNSKFGRSRMMNFIKECLSISKILCHFWNRQLNSFLLNCRKIESSLNAWPYFVAYVQDDLKASK